MSPVGSSSIAPILGAVVSLTKKLSPSKPPAVGDSSQVSTLGQLMSYLDQLQQTDPAQFQKVVGQIATQLSAAAQQQGQTPEGQLLSQLANQFQNLANGGSLSQLSQVEGPHHRHGPQAHHAYVAAQQNSASTMANVNSILSGIVSNLGLKLA